VADPEAAQNPVLSIFLFRVTDKRRRWLILKPPKIKCFLLRQPDPAFAPKERRDGGIRARRRLVPIPVPCWQKTDAEISALAARIPPERRPWCNRSRGLDA